MDYHTEFKGMMREMHGMSADQLVMTMGDGFAALLDDAPRFTIDELIANSNSLPFFEET